MRRPFVLRLFFCLFLLLPIYLSATYLEQEQKKSNGNLAIEQFILLLHSEAETRNTSIAAIKEQWRPEYTAMILEVILLNQDTRMTSRLIDLLEDQTGKKFGFDIHKWYQWLWNQPAQLHPQYANFKSMLYGLIDKKFTDYFSQNRASEIRLDEIVWGGVVQDGIPPLRNPKMIDAAEADYLDDENIVFGLEINGDVRAYPKRILAWHEMFVDEVGEGQVTGVYCTLCGTMILYKSERDGIIHQLGTSGFLYRSNKLIYDQETQSLWNTIWGEPVVGPLAGQNIKLERLSVVTTTWGEWRRRHPQTKVLALETGHERNYAEGAAYRAYFATDDLMFAVPKLDKQLKNKDEILGLLFAEYPNQPLAISVKFLAGRQIHHDRIAEKDFVVFSDKSGANRVYESRDVIFLNWDQMAAVRDEQGLNWKLTEGKLAAEDGRELYRLPAHRAFWFGWYSAYPHTRLVK